MITPHLKYYRRWATNKSQCTCTCGQMTSFIPLFLTHSIPEPFDLSYLEILVFEWFRVRLFFRAFNLLFE